MRHPVGDCIIHQPMPGHGGETFEGRCRQGDGKMPGATGRTGVSDVMMTVIVDDDVRIWKMLLQSLMKRFRTWFHGWSLPVP